MRIARSGSSRSGGSWKSHGLRLPDGGKGGVPSRGRNTRVLASMFPILKRKGKPPEDLNFAMGKREPPRQEKGTSSGIFREISWRGFGVVDKGGESRKTREGAPPCSKGGREKRPFASIIYRILKAWRMLAAGGKEGTIRKAEKGY